MNVQRPLVMQKIDSLLGDRTLDLKINSERKDGIQKWLSVAEDKKVNLLSYYAQIQVQGDCFFVLLDTSVSKKTSWTLKCVQEDLKCVPEDCI